MPENINLTTEQAAVLTAPVAGSMLLKGKAGTGKSTVAVLRMRNMVENGVPGDSVLVLIPQRHLAEAYYREIRSTGFPAGSQPQVLTYNGLAQRMISLFWPLVAVRAGFTSPEVTPRFLNMETAQYYLAHIVEPLLARGYFESLTIDPNRLYSQVLDNLNKSAVVGFPPDEITSRLTNAWAGKSPKDIIYQQAQECALKFRDYCLANNFLDFSLQLSVFTNVLWSSLLCKEYIKKTYRHLIYDNIEEDFPVAHDFVKDLLPELDSALMILDEGGGYRSFLGADPESAHQLANLCTGQIQLNSSFVQTAQLESLENALNESIIDHRLVKNQSNISTDGFSIQAFRFYPQVVDWVIEKIDELVQLESVRPADIAILTPYLSDALRFSFANRLTKAGIPFTTYRPSRSLRDEPAVQAMLTLAKIAHSDWRYKPTLQQTRSAFALVLDECDFVRADLLSRTLYKPKDSSLQLQPFENLNLEMRSRISFRVGEFYEKLRHWLIENPGDQNWSLDHWFSRLFGECLSQPGFGFHNNYDASAAINRLVESCREFRKVYIPSENSKVHDSGEEYTLVLEKGLLTSQVYSISHLSDEENVVFLSPAYSFLMRNRPVKYQFWVDIGSNGWWSRLDQPLTQPYVLNRNWLSGQKWSDEDEYSTNQLTLSRIVTGLLRRCSEHVFLCSVNYNEHGIEERGQLLMAMQTILRIIVRNHGGSGV